METIAAHKIRLDPNNTQRTYLAKAAGTARFAYNWALNEWGTQYKAGGRPTETALRKQLNSIKRDQFPWMYEVTKNSPQQSIKDLGTAFKRFFRKESRYPKFKKKGVRDSFRLDNGITKVDGKQLWVPNLGWVRLREELRFSGKILSAYVSKTADKWFVSLTVETQDQLQKCESQARVGVDLGVKTLATLYCPTKGARRIRGPKALKQNLSKLKRLQRKLSKAKKGSKNREKLKVKVSRLHYRISCIRQDYTHRLTSYLSTQFKDIVIEDLNVKGMVRNRRLSRAISDMGFGEFRRQLEYKTNWYRSTLTVADRFYPSSKRCSFCGNVVKELPLNVRWWKCPSCSWEFDRDANAAKNLVQLVPV